MSTAEQHLSILSKHLNLEDGTILEIGSGGGEVSLALSKRGAKVTGIECSRDQMCRASKHLRSGCRFLLGVGENLPFKESCFDASVFFNSIHHIPEECLSKAISDALKVTKPGGVIYVAEPMAEGPCFELDAPVEDETEVRELAQHALNQARDSFSGWTEETPEHYQVHFDYQKFDDYKDEMLRFDHSRTVRFEKIEDLLKAQFMKLSEKINQGYRFYQPMLARCIRMKKMH